MIVTFLISFSNSSIFHLSILPLFLFSFSSFIPLFLLFNLLFLHSFSVHPLLPVHPLFTLFFHSSFFLILFFHASFFFNPLPVDERVWRWTQENDPLCWTQADWLPFTSDYTDFHIQKIVWTVKWVEAWNRTKLWMRFEIK